jgi:hypothetical protein
LHEENEKPFDDFIKDLKLALPLGEVTETSKADQKSIQERKTVNPLPKSTHRIGFQRAKTQHSVPENPLPIIINHSNHFISHNDNQLLISNFKGKIVKTIDITSIHFARFKITGNENSGKLRIYGNTFTVIKLLI